MHDTIALSAFEIRLPTSPVWISLLLPPVSLGRQCAFSPWAVRWRASSGAVLEWGRADVPGPAPSRRGSAGGRGAHPRRPCGPLCSSHRQSVVTICPATPKCLSVTWTEGGVAGGQSRTAATVRKQGNLGAPHSQVESSGDHRRWALAFCSGGAPPTEASPHAADGRRPDPAASPCGDPQIWPGSSPDSWPDAPDPWLGPWPRHGDSPWPHASPCCGSPAPSTPRSVPDFAPGPDSDPRPSPCSPPRS
jgi:hypothetical protein